MKKIILLIIPFIAFGIMYLCGAFVNATFDIEKWSWFGRSLVVVYGLVLGVFASYLCSQNNEQ